MEDQEEESKEKRQAEITWRVHRRLQSIMSNRLVTKLWVSQWSRSDREGGNQRPRLVDEKKRKRKSKRNRKSLGESPKEWLSTISSRLVIKLWASGRERRRSEREAELVVTG
jgi:hypothetical protein